MNLGTLPAGRIVLLGCEQPGVPLEAVVGEGEPWHEGEEVCHVMVEALLGHLGKNWSCYMEVDNVHVQRAAD